MRALVMGALLVAGRSAHAQGNDAAAAEALFREGKALMAAGNYREACPKLAESNRLDAGTGTLVALGVCHERLGLTASAWAEFNEVVAAAQKEGRQDRLRVAREGIARLEPHLSRLAVIVPPEDTPLAGLRVKRDGEALAPASWGSALPVDPGGHVIEVTADRKKVWTTTVRVGVDGDRQAVTVPPLEDQPAPELTERAETAARAAETTDHPPASGNGRRSAAFVFGGAGVAALGIGAYFGAVALSKIHDANSRCSTVACTDKTAVAENQDGNRDAWVADFAIGADAVAVAIGVYLFVSSPSDATRAAVRIAPSVGTRGQGLVVDGRF